MPTPAATGSHHHPEDVRAFRIPVGPGHRLEAGRRQGDDQLVVAADDRPGDRVRRRGVPLGVVAADPDRPALLVPRLRQPRQHAPDPLLEGRLRDVLEQRDRADLAGDSEPVPDDPTRPRGRSRSVSSNTADAARIKETASHNRRKLLNIHESGRGEDGHHAEAGDGLGHDAGHIHVELDSNPDSLSSRGLPEGGTGRKTSLRPCLDARCLSDRPHDGMGFSRLFDRPPHDIHAAGRGTDLALSICIPTQIDRAMTAIKAMIERRRTVASLTRL